MSAAPKFALVIPTKDRARDIETLLVSIERQSVAPDRVVIVDGGSQPLDAVLQKHPSIPVKYIREKSSITQARNRGIAELDGSTEYVALLDDDLVFQPGALEAMMRFWSTAAKAAGGAGFNIVNHPMPRIGNAFKWPFLLDSKAQGKILPSGYNTIYCPIDKTQRVSWLYGGATMWRREVFSSFKFDEWYEGYGLMEDIDFSYNVSKRYELYVVAGADVLHLHAAGERVPDVTFGQMQIINRYNFVKKHAELSLPLFWWASVGQAVENVARWIVFRKKSFLLKSWGNLAGMARLLADPKAKIRLNNRPQTAAAAAPPKGLAGADESVSIAVVIAAFNAQDYIAQCLESVFAQTRPPDEIIVVDDGSTDRTPELLAKYGGRIKVQRTRNGGLAAARNAGFSLARSRYVALLDYDDYWPPQKLEVYDAYARRYPQAGLFYSDSFSVASGSAYRHVRAGPPGADPFFELLKRCFVASSSAMVERDLWRRVGGVRGGFAHPAGVVDWDFFLMAAKEKPLQYVPEALLYYRVHGTSAMQTRQEAMWKDSVRVVMRHSRRDAVPPAVKAEALASVFYQSGLRFLTAGNIRKARNHFFRSLRTAGSFPSLGLFLVSLTGPFFIPLLLALRRRLLRLLVPASRLPSVPEAPERKSHAEIH